MSAWLHSPSSRSSHTAIRHKILHPIDGAASDWLMTHRLAQLALAIALLRAAGLIYWRNRRNPA